MGDRATIRPPARGTAGNRPSPRPDPAPVANQAPITVAKPNQAAVIAAKPKGVIRPISPKKPLQRLPSPARAAAPAVAAPVTPSRAPASPVPQRPVKQMAISPAVSPRTARAPVAPVAPAPVVESRTERRTQVGSTTRGPSPRPVSPRGTTAVAPATKETPRPPPLPDIRNLPLIMGENPEPALPIVTPVVKTSVQGVRQPQRTGRVSAEPEPEPVPELPVAEPIVVPSPRRGTSPRRGAVSPARAAPVPPLLPANFQPNPYQEILNDAYPSPQVHAEALNAFATKLNLPTTTDANVAAMIMLRYMKSGWGATPTFDAEVDQWYTDKGYVWDQDTYINPDSPYIQAGNQLALTPENFEKAVIYNRDLQAYRATIDDLNVYPLYSTYEGTRKANEIHLPREVPEFDYLNFDGTYQKVRFLPEQNIGWSKEELLAALLAKPVETNKDVNLPYGMYSDKDYQELLDNYNKFLDDFYAIEADDQASPEERAAATQEIDDLTSFLPSKITPEEEALLLEQGVEGERRFTKDNLDKWKMRSLVASEMIDVNEEASVDYLEALYRRAFNTLKYRDWTDLCAKGVYTLAQLQFLAVSTFEVSLREGMTQAQVCDAIRDALQPRPVTPVRGRRGAALPSPGRAPSASPARTRRAD